MSRGSSTWFAGPLRRATHLLVGILVSAVCVTAIRYNDTLDPWNINKNQDTDDVLQYTTPLRTTPYFPSPKNWRTLPTYTLLLDKWIDGDPDNNDFFRLIYEYDWRETQLRAGGDVIGLMDERGLDYLQSMGYEAIYIAGTNYINMPWQADGYSAIDFTLLDPHFGNLTDWKLFVDRLHARGMYIIFDLTVGTMGDLLGFEGHLNSSTPFSEDEYHAVWKRPNYAPWGLDYYPDFNYTNEYNKSCVYPTFFDSAGNIIDPGLTGCMNSAFDQYGDVEAFGTHPDWKRQLAKFASVQDRLREWNPYVLDRLKHFSCLCIQALDIDGIRIDKATQVTVDALADWGYYTRQCAKQLGKDNFFIPGEVTGGDTFGSIYFGRGRTPGMRTTYMEALNLTNNDGSKFLREEGHAPLDSAAFHFSVYRALARYLGMDGDLTVVPDVDVNFVNAWNQMLVNNDFINPQTGNFDPRHQYGTTNQDVFRWPMMANGTQRQLAGMFVTHLLMPGIPITWFGEEQEMYILDSSASNYLYGRQAMVASPAWKRHGCYRLGADQYYNLPYDKVTTGCYDPQVALDHFDPTAPIRRASRNMNWMRRTYPAIQDAFMLSAFTSYTRFDRYPNSDRDTEIGVWAAERTPSEKQRQDGGPGGPWSEDGQISQVAYYIYTNENVSTSYNFDCSDPQKWMNTSFTSGTTIKNLLYPYQEVTLESTGVSFYQNGLAPYRGCIPKLDLEPYDFRVYVPISRWVSPPPALSGFTPGHDARVEYAGDSVEFELQYDQPMDCVSLQAVTNLTYVGESGANPVLTWPADACLSINGEAYPYVSVTPSAWRMKGVITGAAEGMYRISIGNASAQAAGSGNGTIGGGTTGFTDHLHFRYGKADNTFVFIDNDYDNSIFSASNGGFTLNHKAWGADRFRYSANYGKTWTAWAEMEASTSLNASMFVEATMFETKDDEKLWEGDHIMVQYWSKLAGSAGHVVHADANWNGGQRRYPQMLLRGGFNNWGYDLGMPNKFEHTADSMWEMPIMSAWPAQYQLNIWAFDDYFYGDADGNGVIDRLPPSSLTPNFLNVSFPPRPHLAWQLQVNDKTGRWGVVPIGHEGSSIIAFVLLMLLPLITALVAAGVFRYSFYAIKINKWGVKPTSGGSNYFPIVGGANHGEKKDGSHLGLTEKVVHHEKVKPLERMIGWPEDTNKRRKVLIATLEYEITDWKLKVKIGGLGVMSSLMGKAMNDVDMIWVVPKVQDLEYPQGDFAEPIEVIIFGEPYLIEVETHCVDNITFVILDSPVFRAQTKSDPYPQRMDDLSSAIFYSTWNQAIAETIRRFEDIDIYHINDYHGALAPLYLLPQIMPVCLSLHNAEFQGLWPLRTKDEMKEVCAAFNISKDVCSKYVQFGNTFNLLHAGASFISQHQKSVGVAGVSDKYGKRSWARYPALWTLRNIDSLPNPDPTDIAALDEQPVAMDKIQVDKDAEAQRPEHKRQAQEWAKLKQDPKADLFVFVGRWSKQKGVDLIADVMPSLLEKRQNIQLICVGPVIDLYGRFAAEKLARLMEMYPDRVFSKPEFTQLPPFLFSGADFALIPSRDEPFGLVAVEFGRKGALGVGARLGGLGLMPGWWFPVESPAAEHMLSQFTKTIKLALKSTEEERAILRARSAVQRFPVVEWRQRLEDFQKRSITMSRSLAGEHAWGWEFADPNGPPRSSMLPSRDSMISLQQSNRPGSPDSQLSVAAADTRRLSENSEQLPPGAAASDDRASLGVDYHRRFDKHQSSDKFYDEDPSEHRGRPKFFTGYDDDTESHISSERDTTIVAPHAAMADGGTGHVYDNFLAAANRQFAKTQGNKNVPDPFMERRMSSLSIDSSNFAPPRPFSIHSRVWSFDSIGSLADEKHSSSLNKAMDTFTDADGEVAQAFVQKLRSLSSGNSKGDLCIEKFLMKSEKQFFSDMKKEKHSAMSIRSRDSIMAGRTPSTLDGFRADSPVQYSMSGHSHPEDFHESMMFNNDDDEKPMTRIQVFMDKQIGGWPLYAIVISLGQLLSATSFQLSLLGGANTQTATDMYIICAIFVIATFLWYTLFRMRPSVYVLTIPWAIFGVAFFLIGFPSLRGPFTAPRKWIVRVATWCYAVASGAGFLFFGLNFGEEAGAAAEVWIMRACVVQGLQQIWVSALWYWGFTLNGTNPLTFVVPRAIIYVVWPLAAMSFSFAVLMYFGLPEYYHQIPPYVPNFFKTLVRRKLVIWFMISEVLRNYWLSTVYGRNWQFLWRDANVPTWSVVIMIVIFFIGIWGLVMGIIMKFAKVHAWLLPVFAVGLGAPRWCQMFWGISGLGLYVSWGGAAGPYIGTCLWLWLGVLDAVQGVGLGMILLQTLSRLHVCATLAAAQFIGSIVVMLARATAPNKEGPGNVFPNAAYYDPATGANNPVKHWEFWVCLVCQLIIPFGYFFFFRKEQLTKP
ncbi:hypothetical protein CcaverHIS631_0410920 [Cutaneotrichosporon cavernicola]|nr:hypothetical protein CcaverHIS631_0410920 [Cutaneotrichosporon cavernicola]